jgi:hypothetical protein
MVRSSPVRDHSVTIDDVTYKGTYYTHGAMVYVQYGAGRKQTQIGGSSPESMAICYCQSWFAKILG